MPGICYNPVSQTEWIKQGQVSLLSPHPLFQSIFRPKVLSLSLFLAISHMLSLSFLGWTPRAFRRHALGFSLLYCFFPPPALFPLPVQAYKSPQHNTRQKLLTLCALLMHCLKVAAASTSKKKQLFLIRLRRYTPSTGFTGVPTFCANATDENAAWDWPLGSSLRNSRSNLPSAWHFPFQ